MGTGRRGCAEAVTETETLTPPGRTDVEVTLLGPGYGESVVLHVGDGVWVLIDSCVGADHKPVALHYLQQIGVDPAQHVAMIVASHWHDDHIRGMEEQVAACVNAEFCCSAALCRKEFLAMVGSLENPAASTPGSAVRETGSGVREIRGVFSRLESSRSSPTRALANRCVFRHDACEIWALSPADAVFERFLKATAALLPDPPRPRRRLPTLSPNDVAVALWVKIAGVAVLLGSDLERSGWISVLDSQERPSGTASVFKVAHHGSADADETRVWDQLLETQPVAALTPWHRGANALPKVSDVNRILLHTSEAYITAPQAAPRLAGRSRPRMVERTLRDTSVKLRRVALSTGGVRLRRQLVASANWTVTKLNDACHLRDFIVG